MSTELEKIENDVAGSRILTFKAVHGKQQGRLRLYPMQLGNTGQIMGIEPYTEAEKRDLKRPVTPDTFRDFTDDCTLNLGNIVDAEDWKWIQHCPEIAESRDKAHESPKACFYIDQPDKEIQKRIKTADLVREALNYIHDSSVHRKWEICRLMGQDVKYFKPEEIDDFLKTKATEEPEKIIAKYNDKYTKVRLFFYKLVDNKYIKADSNGIYKYKEQILGTNVDGVLHWLMADENKELIRLWALELTPKKPENNVDPSKFDIEIPEMPKEIKKPQAPKK
jgi:hypothetical protein